MGDDHGQAERESTCPQETRKRSQDSIFRLRRQIPTAMVGALVSESAHLNSLLISAANDDQLLVRDSLPMT